MKKKTSHRLVSVDTIEKRIYMIRGHKVILDCDLAELYGVPTKRLNEQVKRNRERFPEDFMFRLTDDELEVLRSKIVTSNPHDVVIRSQIATASKRNIRYLPSVFTEHGALMVANILNSEVAVRMSIYVIRAFVRMREIFVVNQILETRLTEIEKILLSHDGALRDLYEKIQPLLTPPREKPKRRIGFHGGKIR